jgi:dTDP-4-amino-4,6-dideoxygalactose transaminase
MILMEKIPVFMPNLQKDTIEHISKVFETGWLGMGSTTKEFEVKIKEFLNLEDRFVLSTNTATSALHLALRGAKIGKSDEVITPSFNCVADQQAIKMAGADVVMCDITEKTLGIDCSKAEELISEKTKAIIPLHYGGIPCDQKGVYDLAKKYNLRVLEDGCHAFGTTINNNKIGSYGDMTVFSFDSIKTMTSIDGGCLILNSKEEFEQLEQMRLLGMHREETEARYKNKKLWINYDVTTEGYRYHLSNVLASIGISQINEIDNLIESRQMVCKRYNTEFSNIDGLVVPNSDYKNVSPFIYVLRVLNGKREELIEHLKKLLIDTGIHWTPVHRFSYFSESKIGDMSITDKIADEILTIPLHSNMKVETVDRIVDGIISFFKK